MTTHTRYQTTEGEVTLMTNPGAAPIVFLNGVIQQPGTYSLSGTNVIFDHLQELKWKPWFAWHPVRIKGKWYWLTQVYRRKTNTYVNYDDWARYEYGDDFDLLKESK
jgi:hypothetical protein